MGDFKGVLSIQVQVPPIVAGSLSTVILVIRNTFPEEVVIDSIQAPVSAPLLSRHSTSLINDLFAQFFWPKEKRMTKDTVSIAPLIAKFPDERAREFNTRVDNNGAETSQKRLKTDGDGAVAQEAERKKIGPFQEEIASFEICTAHWLLVTPKDITLNAVIRYRLGDEERSQILPFTVSVHPPIGSIIIGTAIGSILGYTVSQLNGTLPNPSTRTIIFGLIGLFLMATILSVILSRRANSKNFLTLEDFYGAFVIGVFLGLSGPSYFYGLIHKLQDDTAVAQSKAGQLAATPAPSAPKPPPGAPTPPERGL